MAPGTARGQPNRTGQVSRAPYFEKLAGLDFCSPAKHIGEQTSVQLGSLLLLGTANDQCRYLAGKGVVKTPFPASGLQARTVLLADCSDAEPWKSCAASRRVSAQFHAALGDNRGGQ